jgi:hypothetical protein
MNLASLTKLPDNINDIKFKIDNKSPTIKDNYLKLPDNNL